MDRHLFRYVWRHTRGEQLFLLFLVLVSLPLYWASLEVPKQIVNQAIVGTAFENGRTTAQFFAFDVALPDWLGGFTFFSFGGVALERLPFLMALSLWFLVLTIANNAFKYVINLRKGILGERMLRRMRYELFAILMRFRPDDLVTLKPAEAATMIKDEVDPIGGFIGDAFIQPVFLITQAGTALLFILMQSFWMGLAAVMIVLIQAIVIPILRREQVRLGRQRQLVSRQLAGRIGEVMENAPVVHGFGATPRMEAEIGDRLGHLYTIRTDLFKRKFFVKFLNNLLAQITPFIFYAVGGYFALRGTLDIGQLVAVINAYKDLPPPMKELIDWDQQRQDATVKYEQVAVQFSPANLLPAEDATTGVDLPAADASIMLCAVNVVDSRGVALIDRATVTLGRPAQIAFADLGDGTASILARCIARRIVNYEGEIRVGDLDIRAVSDRTLSRFMSFAGSDPELLPGSIRTNLLLPVLRVPPPAVDKEDLPPGERLRLHEAKRSGNPLVTADADWIDYQALGIEAGADVDATLLDLLGLVGALDDVYVLGVLGRFAHDADPQTLAAFVDARAELRAKIESDKLADLVEFFDPETYNGSASVLENLTFGVPLGNHLFEPKALVADTFFHKVIDEAELTAKLIRIGFEMASLAVETFKDLPPDHPVFERYSTIHATDLPHYHEIIEIAKARGIGALPQNAENDLIAIGLDYSEPRHQLGLVDDDFRTHAIAARKFFREELTPELAEQIELYEPGRYMLGASVRDNLLSGRITYGVANARPRIYAMAKKILSQRGLDRYIFQLGLDFEVGKGGYALQPAQRTRISLARALVSQPEIVVLNDAFSGLTHADAESTLRKLRTHLKQKTLIVTLHDENAAAADYDQVITFDGARAIEHQVVETRLSA